MSKPNNPRWKTNVVGKPKTEVAKLRGLVAHRQLAYIDTLTNSQNADVIRQRADKLKEAKDALQRALGRKHSA